MNVSIRTLNEPLFAVAILAIYVMMVPRQRYLAVLTPALLIAMVLVFLVMYLFLGNWRATFIPAIVVPVALTGTARIQPVGKLLPRIRRVRVRFGEPLDFTHLAGVTPAGPVRRQVTGPGTAALLAGCQAAYQSERLAAGVRAGEPLGRAYVSEEAFRWVVYSPAAATVDIVSAGPGSQGATVRAVTQIEVTWSGGDWQVIAPVGGDWGNSAAPLTSLRGYTAFPIPPA